MKTKLLLIVFLLNVSYILIAQIIHVPGDQPNIQEGINAANTGDTVLVDEDTYFENINFKGKAITLASNFILDEDTTHINNTIINGSQPIHPDSASVVSFISGEDTTSIICGFTITGGSGLMFPSSGTCAGGGIICKNSGATISNNKIVNNEVSFQSIACGGGIAAFDIYGVSSIIIENNVISNNSVMAVDIGALGGGLYLEMNAQVYNNSIEQNNAESELSPAFGGGVYCFSEQGLMYNFEFVSNKINSNYLYGTWVRGGGVYAIWSELSMSGNEINNNWLYGDTSSGGGICLWQSAGNINITENEIINNKISIEEYWSGCGIYIYKPDVKTQIIKNIISGNTGYAVSNALGGGIYISNSLYKQVILDGNIFSDNNAFAGGGIYARDVLNCDITNNIFSFNTGDLSGGAVYLNDPSKEDDATNSNKSNLDNKTDTVHFVMANNTFYSNTAGGNGGAVRNWDKENLIIFNSIFWDNEGAAGSEVHNASSFEVNIAYSNIDPAGIDGNWTGIGNINEDPLFIDPENGDFHIEDSSPCAGKGIDLIDIIGLTCYCPEIDFESDLRPWPSTEMPDMGADEIDETVEISEVNIPNSSLQLSNYPNPFTNRTTIELNIPQSGFVRLSIVDFTGKEIQTLISKQLLSGTHQYEWNAARLPNGIYFLRLETNGISETRKLMILK